MPRSTRGRGSRSRSTTATLEPATPVTTETDEVKNMTTAVDETEDTVRELPFEVQITPAEEGYKPDRSPAGRKRIPSPFEPVLPGLKGKGWQNQPHDGMVKADENGKFNTTTSVAESNAKAILRELSKAVKFLNSEEGGELNLGLDVNVTEELVQFNIRDKQNRKPRTPQGEDAADGERDDDEETTGDE